MPDGHTAGLTGNETKDGTTPRNEPEGLVVRYRYGEGVLLHGDTYPHKDAIKKAVPRWRWFRSMGQWGVTATRDKAMTRAAVQRYADGLTKAGLPGVRVDYEAPKPEDVRPAAELFEERQRRSRRRAEAASQRADRLEQEATRQYEASHDAVRHIPMGQPILLGHHSQRKHERAVKRAHAAMGRSVQAEQEAERARAQARGSEAQAASRESPPFAIRRLRELTTEAREIDVRLTGETPPDWRGLAPSEPATGDDRSMLLTRQREVEERSAYFRALLEEAHVPAMQIAPRPMELVITERGPATAVKTTAKRMKVKRGGRMVTVAREWVWLPKAILALRAEQPLTRDEVLMLWKAQHDPTTRALSPEQHEALESLVEMGLVVPHPDLRYAGIYLATNLGKAIELPEGKPKTWLERWDGLQVTPATEGEGKRRPAANPKAEPQPKPGPQAKAGTQAPAGTQAKTESSAKPGPKAKTPADVDRLVETLGLKPSRTPEIGRMREAMVHAVREGLGQEMKVWLIRHTRARINDIDAAHGYARGVIALENGGWPPSPLRGKSYGEDHFRGVVQSLRHLPEVMELLDAALSWDDDMTEATGSRRHTHWFDDGRIADLARRIMSDLDLERISKPKDRTPQRAEELREWVRRSALRQLARLRIPLDPSLYDPQADPEVVYRKVCEVDSEAARKILDEVFGVEFQPGTDGSIDASDLCDGKKTLDDLRAEAGERAATKAKDDAARTSARRQDAEALLRVANDAAKRGPITTRRFNNAYWRLHPELQAKRKRRALMVQRKGARTEASVHGPGDQRFFVSIEGDREDALAALMLMIMETATTDVSAMTAEDAVQGAPAATKKGATPTAKTGTTPKAKKSAPPKAKKSAPPKAKQDASPSAKKVTTPTPELRDGSPSTPATVDVDAIAKEIGISGDRWPPFDKLEAAFLAAERLDAGSAMRNWFQERNLHRPGDLARMHGRVRGTLALERGAWPPPPLRGTTYGREHFAGILSSLDHLPVMVELEELAKRWPERMQELTKGRWRYWYDDGRMAYLASGTVRDLNASILRGVTGSTKATPALAHEAREKIEASAKYQIERLTATLDPVLYDPKTPPEQVYPKLCEIESDLARKVLKDVHGVRFDWHRAGRTDAYKLCQGETTIAEIERKADVREAEDRAREAESQARKAEDARALLKVFDKVAKGGEVTPTRFNLAYWRAHPEISKYRRKEHGLRIRRGAAWVRGPKDYGFSARFYEPVSEAEAIAALFEEVRTAAGVATGSEEETPKATPSMKKGRARKANPKGSRSSSTPGRATSAPSGRTSTPIREDAPLPEDFPVYGSDGSVTHGPKYAAYMVHHGQTDPETMMGRDTARYPNPLEGYLRWLQEHPTDAETTDLAELEAESIEPDELEAEGEIAGPTEAEAEATSPTDPRHLAEAVARLEYVDVATGAPTDPSELGTLSTGRVVAEVDGETVEIDEEDLLGHGSDPDPRKRRYRFDADSPADYPGQAKAKKTARTAKKGSSRIQTKTKAGLRDTFDSAPKAAALFYEHNADFFDHVRDPWDGLRDWMDGIEVRVGRGKGHRKLARTEAGKRILRQKHAAVAIRQALAYLMGKAKGRRWEDVPWEQVDRLGEALARYYEAPDREAGQPGIYWRPFTGTVRVEDLDAMTPEQREAIRAQEAAQEIGEQLEQLRDAYARAKGCLPKEVRQVVERRIVEWTRWVKEPTEIPGYACEPDPATAGYLCNYPSVAGELAQLRRSCEDAYDPNWAAKPSKQGAAGFPDTSGGEDELPPTGGVSAKACCSRTLESLASATPAPTTPAAGAPPTRTGTRSERSSAGPAPPRAAPKGSRRKTKVPDTRPTPLADKGQTSIKQPKAPATKAKGRSRSAARRQNPKVLASQRRAQRLACSAEAARHQAETIDTTSYAARLQAAKEAVKEAERLNKTRIKEFEAAKKHHAAVRVNADVDPKELTLARRQAHEARCNVQFARSALAQRKRDHARATTELRRAEQRVKGRKAVADRRERIAKQATAQAEALARRA